MTVLVTGASGFVGRHLVDALLNHNFKVRAVRRKGNHQIISFPNVELVSLSGEGYASDDWTEAMSGCDVVIHLAALAHMPRDARELSEHAIQRANIDLALACAASAAKVGVRRFIFMSSAGVHGGLSVKHPINADDNLSPHTSYAKSKALAELKLKESIRFSRMDLTVLRPPLIYGANAPGNFNSLKRAVASGWPLPLGLVTTNRRSFVFVDNLVDLIITCIDHPGAANKSFLVSDGDDVSTATFLRYLGLAMGRPVRLLPFPIGWLALGASLLDKRHIFDSLCGSFQLDINQTRQVLGWSPTYTLSEGLRRCFTTSH